MFFFYSPKNHGQEKEPNEALTWPSSFNVQSHSTAPKKSSPLYNTNTNTYTTPFPHQKPNSWSAKNSLATLNSPNSLVPIIASLSRLGQPITNTSSPLSTTSTGNKLSSHTFQVLENPDLICTETTLWLRRISKFRCERITPRNQINVGEIGESGKQATQVEKVPSFSAENDIVSLTFSSEYASAIELCVCACVYVFLGYTLKFFRWSGHQLNHSHNPYALNLIMDLLEGWEKEEKQ